MKPEFLSNYIAAKYNFTTIAKLFQLISNLSFKLWKTWVRVLRVVVEQVRNPLLVQFLPLPVFLGAVGRSLIILICVKYKGTVVR